MVKTRKAAGRKLIILAVGFFLLGGGYPDWETLTQRNITVHHSAEDSEVAKRVLAEAGSFFPFSRSLRPDLLKDEIHIFIAPSHESFRELSKGMIPHWTTACAFPRKSLVIVKSPRIVKVWREDLKVVLRHELVHIFMHRIAPGGVPTWFNEGVAIYMSGEWGLRDNFDLSIAVISGKLIPLNEMRGEYPSQESRVNLFYLESYSAVAFLAAHLGKDRFMDFFHRLLTSGSFESALYQHTGMTLENFEMSWKGWLKSSYHPLSLFGRTEFLFIIFMLIMVMAYLLRRRKYKKILAEMETFEEHENPY